MDSDVQRVAIVTGGANGIGAAVSHALRQSGVRVVIADRDAEAGRTMAKSGEFDFLNIDLTDPRACAELVDTTVRRYQQVDILVNNAGFQHVCSLGEFPEDTWNAMIDLMLNAPFRLTKSVWPHMQRNNWGRVINMASIHSQVASTNKSAYVAAKHGLVGLTKTAALEGGEYGITVNAISPGYVRSALVENQIADQALVNNMSEDEVQQKILFKNSSVKRLIEPEEVAKLAAMLCSDEAQSITGSTITIDGGWTAQ